MNRRSEFSTLSACAVSGRLPICSGCTSATIAHTQTTAESRAKSVSGHFICSVRGVLSALARSFSPAPISITIPTVMSPTTAIEAERRSSTAAQINSTAFWRRASFVFPLFRAVHAEHFSSSSDQRFISPCFPPHLTARPVESFGGYSGPIVTKDIMSSPVIRPKKPNHAMERTSDLCAFTFEMTSTPSLQATRALVRRRSSCSR
jgi:hypothetical protein